MLSDASGETTGLLHAETLGLEVRRVSAQQLGPQFPRLMQWLDEGLRSGRQGRLAAEYGPILTDESTGHVIVLEGGRWLSHALYRTLDLVVGELQIRVGIIGLVFTDPEARGRGLARRCVAEAVGAISSAGGQIAMLWSDKPEFYASQGFSAAGRDVFYRVSPSVRACIGKSLSSGWEVSSPCESDWSSLERMYSASRSHVVRKPGLLRGLAMSPDCQVAVARKDGSVRAYAAVGRGDDFRNVIHEWHGEPDGVLACVCALAEGSAEMAIVGGPVAGELHVALRAAGATAVEQDFALVRLLDAPAVWDRLRAHAGTGSSLELERRHGRDLWVTPTSTRPLVQEDLLGWLFGPTRPEAFGSWLEGQGDVAVAPPLPVPPYLWGFDSI